MHDAAPRGLIFDDRCGDVQDLARRYLPRAVGVLPDAQLLHGAFPGVVLRHTDDTAPNWLWDGARLTVIDLEMARPGPGEEAGFLRTVRAFDALVMVVWCHTHGDPAGEQRFRQALNLLL